MTFLTNKGLIIGLLLVAAGCRSYYRATPPQAALLAEVPSSTLMPYVPAPPSSLELRLSNISNQPISDKAYTGADYHYGISAITGLAQGSYTWTLTEYVQGVLNNTISNNGFLVRSPEVDQPTRVALASPRSPLNKMQLRIYLISLQ